MYNSVGKKLKIIAIVVAVIGCIYSLVIGMYIMAQKTLAGASFIYGSMIIILGCLLSWVLSLAIYGFGELFINVEKIANNTKIGWKKQIEVQENETSEKIHKIIEDESIKNENEIVIRCPHCDEKISFYKEEILTQDIIKCHECSYEIYKKDIKSSE